MMVSYGFVWPQEMFFDAPGFVQCYVLGLICFIGFSLIQFYKPGANWTIIPTNLLIVLLCLLYYFPFNLILLKGINPLGKSTSSLSTNIAISPVFADLNQIAREFNEGQTIFNDAFLFDHDN
jgi:phosphoglycerol transferase MdoB-like AlkP superfamily enzyme